jgi:hypothetical protein
MKYKSLGLTVLLVAFAGSALGQTQVSGTFKCGKGGTGDIEYTVEVPDHPGHILIMDKGGATCTFPTPIEIAGLKATAWSGAGTTEVNGAKFQERDSGVQTMENGDKVYVRSQSTGTMTEGGKAFTYEGTWSWTGGTGKLKGLKGKGTLKGSGTGDGGTTSQIEGEYTLPAAGATASKK